MTESTFNLNWTKALPESHCQSALPDWDQITRKMQLGDTSAFAVYYEAMFPIMLREAKRCSGLDEATCLDIVQESMLKAIKSIKPIAHHARITSWSRAVVKTVAWDWFRKQKRKRELSLTHEDVRKFDAGSSIEDEEMEARIVWLENELHDLPAELRSMISLKYRLGWTLKQIASKFGLKTGAVDGRIRRAVEQLKQKASQEYDQ